MKQNQAASKGIKSVGVKLSLIIASGIRHKNSL